MPTSQNGDEITDQSVDQIRRVVVARMVVGRKERGVRLLGRLVGITSMMRREMMVGVGVLAVEGGLEVAVAMVVAEVVVDIVLLVEEAVVEGRTRVDKRRRSSRVIRSITSSNLFFGEREGLGMLRRTGF